MSLTLKLARIQRIFNNWWGLIQNLTPGVAHGEFLPELDRASQCRGTRVDHDMSPKYRSHSWPRGQDLRNGTSNCSPPTWAGENAMAPHSNTLAWKIPWMEEPGRLQSMGSWRVGHDWATSLSLFTFTHWRRKWQPTPVFLSRESQGWWSLVGCHLLSHTESDTTEAT